MVVTDGLTVILTPDPSDVPPQLPEYHCQLAAVPSDPPETERSVLSPGQVGETETPALVGSTDNVLTTIEIF